MKIGLLGTGVVAQTMGTKLIALGHGVHLGGRQARNAKADAWAAAAGEAAAAGTFAEAAVFGELLFNCTLGSGSLLALHAAGANNLRDKILVDVSNPLDMSKGMPPSLFTGLNDSLGEQIQRAFPTTRVVKTLNTVNCAVMVNPEGLDGGAHDMFVCGNDAAAKAKVSELLREGFGWKSVLDFGDITGARALEAYVLFWVRAWGALGTSDFNLRLVR